MSFTHQDLKDHYVLGGRCHDPAKNDTLFDRHVNGCFTIILNDSVKDDESAIKDADVCVEVDIMRAKPGERITATLHFNNRIVKNYPEVVKE